MTGALLVGLSMFVAPASADCAAQFIEVADPRPDPWLWIEQYDPDPTPWIVLGAADDIYAIDLGDLYLLATGARAAILLGVSRTPAMSASSLADLADAIGAETACLVDPTTGMVQDVTVNATRTGGFDIGNRAGATLATAR